jgi:hypothetical protein
MRKKNKYFEWLHDLTLLGYEENIMISTDHNAAIQYFFASGLTPAATLERYKDFVKRYNAIKAAKTIE